MDHLSFIFAGVIIAVLFSLTLTTQAKKKK